MSEHQEQVTFFDWVRLNREFAPNLEVRKALKLCYAVPNGANLPKKKYKDKNGQWKTWSPEAKWLKEEGALEEGLPDINLDVLKQYFSDDIHEELISIPGLRIEKKYRADISARIQAKIDTGNFLTDLSPEQEEKRELLIAAGFKVVVSYSAVQDIRTVFEYLPFKVKDYQGIKEFL